VLLPLRSTTLTWRKASPPVGSCTKPKPFSGLYHFTVAETGGPAGAASKRGLLSRGAYPKFVGAWEGRQSPFGPIARHGTSLWWIVLNHRLIHLDPNLLPSTRSINHSAAGSIPILVAGPFDRYYGLPRCGQTRPQGLS
jgi:hypothetical protein